MFVVKKDLMKLGFSSWQAMMLVKQAKAKLASQGLTWYESKGLGRVPLETVEEILGVKINEADLLDKDCLLYTSVKTVKRKWFKR